MIHFTEIVIGDLEDYNQLYDCVKPAYIDEYVVDKIKKYIGLKCDTVLVEYPYYDKEYLSNYYVHYAQKFKKYDKACYRIHFEKGNQYLGYSTLRPTPDETKFGKTFIIPEVVLSKKAYLMLGDYKAHIHGQEESVRAFPWKRQESDISCCAHTATWAILKYFGNKYKNYSDTTIGDVVDKVRDDGGRKIPTIGLTPSQVADVLKKYDFCPLIIGGKKSDYSIADEIIAYVESGIPLVGFFNTSPDNHAVSIIGHGEINYDLLNPDMVDNYIDSKSGVILHSKLIESIYVMDDRFFPYMEVPKSLPTKNDNVDYSLAQLDYAVIPLYKRMLLSYTDVYNRMITWVKSREFAFGQNPICRIYIASSNSLKENAAKNKTMPEDIKHLLISLSLPKFVWCIDFADMKSYKNNMTTGRIIVDTTGATLEKEPWILMHDLEKIRFKDYDEEAEIYEINGNYNPYDMFVHNLAKKED